MDLIYHFITGLIGLVLLGLPDGAWFFAGAFLIDVDHILSYWIVTHDSDIWRLPFRTYDFYHNKKKKKNLLVFHQLELFPLFYFISKPLFFGMCLHLFLDIAHGAWEILRFPERFGSRDVFLTLLMLYSTTARLLFQHKLVFERNK